MQLLTIGTMIFFGVKIVTQKYVYNNNSNELLGLSETKGFDYSDFATLAKISCKALQHRHY